MLSESYMLGIFAAVITVMLAFDLGIFNKSAHHVSNREALFWSITWIGLSMLFSVFIYYEYGLTKWTEFQTAYWIEKALSVDNLFMFIIIFRYFKVNERYHHKVLFWGILGAIITRGVLIFTGAQVINLTYLDDFTWLGLNFHEFNIVLTLFGIFLVYAGIKSAGADSEDERDFGNSFSVKLVKKIFPVTHKFDGGKFFTIENGKTMATLLLMVVAVVEITDLLFAVDSIPAIFTVSRDPIILYTSNIFAILGLRTLYFLLHNFMKYFAYLKYGLAFILAFIGLKMIVAPVFHISSEFSLIVVAGVLIISSLASIIWNPEKQP